MSNIKKIYPLNKIINNLSNEEYHASDPISSSNCKDLLISPWLFNYKRQNQMEPTPAMKFGTLFHSLVLEPKTFDDEYVVADIPKRNTKQGKADYQELIETVGARQLVSTDDFLQAQEMRHNLAKNELVRTLLSGGIAEKSVFWVDEASKVNCKARADYINLEEGYIVDLKTTSSLADDINFSFTTRKYHYDLSASFYVDGFKQATGKEFDFYFIAIETNAPFNYGIYKLSSGLIEQGRGKYSQALEVFAKARERGNFNVPYNGGNLIELVA
ncbi:PD-(D/E)XK nuclease-like domain-containing protein [Cysteiniphilum sp. 6C5]|uniref:PD-(D/E)XK nuclease-like domain-containing protein n=1 Tax=unclassified Cysteiniphilum TaxID=2610889 RepID=UPI003F841C07